MINFQSILSTFNEKGTLLKWLQKVEKALTESVLENVTVSTPTAGAAVFSFNFADGTVITTPPVPLPKGENGADGTNGADGVGINSVTAGAPYIAGDYTVTPVSVQLSDGTSDDLTVRAKNGTNGTNGENGADGEDGATITGITTQGSRQVDGYTETEIDVSTNKSETPFTFTVRAKNGENGADGTNGADGAAGVGIVTVHALSHYQLNGETITVCEAVLTNGETSQFEVHAQNGEGKALYHHLIYLNAHWVGWATVDHHIYISIISSQNTPINTLDRLKNYLSSIQVDATNLLPVSGWASEGVAYTPEGISGSSSNDISIQTAAQGVEDAELTSITDQVTTI